MRSLLIIWILLLLASCGKKPSEEVDEAIDVALTYLSDEKCDEAIDVLEDAGRDTSNPIYLQVLASAYACRANYNEVKFLDTQITAIQSTATGFMRSLAILDLSKVEVEADSDEYKDLRTALGVILNVDANQPSQARREAKYGPRKAGDMGIQALFLSLTQLGKFLHYYGNVNVTTGVKGGGAGLSKCFLTYNDVQAMAFIAGSGATGSCTAGTMIGHADLSLAPADLAVTKKRMCEGLMLVTNVIDILNNITLPDNDAMGDLSTVTTTINTLKTTITTADPALTTLIETTSQSACETLADDATEFGHLQLLYAALFEVGLP